MVFRLKIDPEENINRGLKKFNKLRKKKKVEKK